MASRGGGRSGIRGVESRMVGNSEINPLPKLGDLDRGLPRSDKISVRAKP